MLVSVIVMYYHRFQIKSVAIDDRWCENHELEMIFNKIDDNRCYPS